MLPGLDVSKMSILSRSTKDNALSNQIQIHFQPVQHLEAMVLQDSLAIQKYGPVIEITND